MPEIALAIAAGVGAAASVGGTIAQGVSAAKQSSALAAAEEERRRQAQRQRTLLTEERNRAALEEKKIDASLEMDAQARLRDRAVANASSRATNASSALGAPGTARTAGKTLLGQ